MSTPTDASNTNGGQPLWRKLLAFIIAALVLASGIWLLVDLWGGKPVAAPFTRVGGETRVETALEASRFWREPLPRDVVTIPGWGSPDDIMFEAAKCAMAHDAPLLFTSPDPKRQWMVDATIAIWEKDAANDHAHFKRWNKGDLAKCQVGTKPDLNRLSTLKVPNESSELPQEVKAQDSLAPLVVFAADRAPGDPPDVAVGLALAAHMAKDRKVSMIVVPRYLEADPGLEDQLRKQGQVVEGGIVLGWPRVLSEDTRALLRQVLTSTDRQGFLGEVRTTLGSVEPLVAAFLALFGLGAVYVTAPNKSEVARLSASVARFRHRVVEGIQESRVSRDIMYRIGRNRPDLQPTLDPWLKALGGDPKRPVTVRLRSGWQVTGTMRLPEKDAHTVTVLRLNDVTNFAEHGPGGSEKRPEFVLVRVEDVEVIVVPVQEKTPTTN